MLESFLNDEMQGMWKETLAASGYEAPFWYFLWLAEK
jgi:hypothetical protein